MQTQLSTLKSGSAFWKLHLKPRDAGSVQVINSLAEAQEEKAEVNSH